MINWKGNILPAIICATVVTSILALRAEGDVNIGAVAVLYVILLGLGYVVCLVVDILFTIISELLDG